MEVGVINQGRCGVTGLFLPFYLFGGCGFSSQAPPPPWVCLLPWLPLLVVFSCRGGGARPKSTYKVWRVAPSARVRGPALLLLGLHLSLGGTVRTVTAALVPSTAAISTFSSAAAATATATRLPLAVALVVVWVLAVTWRAPPARVAPVPVAVGSVLAALDGDASGPGDVGRLCSLETRGGPTGLVLGAHPLPQRVI